MAFLAAINEQNTGTHDGFLWNDERIMSFTLDPVVSFQQLEQVNAVGRSATA